MALRSSDSTITIRVDDVRTMRIDGASARTVTSTISWISRPVRGPDSPRSRLNCWASAAEGRVGQVLLSADSGGCSRQSLDDLKRLSDDNPGSELTLESLSSAIRDCASVGFCAASMPPSIRVSDVGPSITRCSTSSRRSKTSRRLPSTCNMSTIERRLLGDY